eukprot:TRINITY_DN4714_c0_g1_i4.p1 TRINITY_DN4714_c0_g1~~TRINITY_DN4714_c0_g1_i4.p1  ORF type:complete len:1170 (-),score=340.73 TRINITY_DN4714_c0_g1_i4:32-3541(-)
MYNQGYYLQPGQPDPGYGVPVVDPNAYGYPSQAAYGVPTPAYDPNLQYAPPLPDPLQQQQQYDPNNAYTPQPNMPTVATSRIQPRPNSQLYVDPLGHYQQQPPDQTYTQPNLYDQQQQQQQQQPAYGQQQPGYGQTGYDTQQQQSQQQYYQQQQQGYQQPSPAAPDYTQQQQYPPVHQPSGFKFNAQAGVILQPTIPQPDPSTPAPYDPNAYTPTSSGYQQPLVQTPSYGQSNSTNLYPYTPSSPSQSAQPMPNNPTSPYAPPSYGHAPPSPTAIPYGGGAVPSPPPHHALQHQGSYAQLQHQGSFAHLVPPAQTSPQQHNPSTATSVPHHFLPSSTSPMSSPSQSRHRLTPLQHASSMAILTPLPPPLPFSVLDSAPDPALLQAQEALKAEERLTVEKQRQEEKRLQQEMEERRAGLEAMRLGITSGSATASSPASHSPAKTGSSSSSPKLDVASSAQKAFQDAERERAEREKAEQLQAWQQAEMKRQMDDLMRERELVQKHEAELRETLLKEQQLMQQNLRKQQEDLAKQQAEVESRLKEEQARRDALARQREEEIKAKEVAVQSKEAVLRRERESVQLMQKMSEQERMEYLKTKEGLSKEKEGLNKEKEGLSKEKDQVELMRKSSQKEQEELLEAKQQITREKTRLSLLQQATAQQEQEFLKKQAEGADLERRLQAEAARVKAIQEELHRQQELLELQRKELEVKQRTQEQQHQQVDEVTKPMRTLLAPGSGPSWSPAVSPSILRHVLPTDPAAGRSPAAPRLGDHPPHKPSPPPAPKKVWDPNQVVEGYKMGDVLRLQQLVRRWLFKMKFVRLVRDFQASSESLRQRSRLHAVQELYTTELSYVAGLQTLENYYRVPMYVQAMALPPPNPNSPFPVTAVTTIFSNLPSLLSLSKDIVEMLEQRIHNWTNGQRVGDVFVKMAPIMKLYAEYVNNYEQSCKVLAEVMGTEKGASVLRECKKRSSSNLDISSMLIMPVQRLPRYELMLRELIKYTDPTHVDHDNLKNAHQQIQNTNNYINERKRNSDGRMRMITLAKMIKDCPIDLVAAHRFCLHEGVVSVSSSRKQESGAYYFFLFNDVLMATKKKDPHFYSSSPAVFHYHHHYDLSTPPVPTLTDVPDSTMFRLVEGRLDSIDVNILTFSSASSQEKAVWIENLEYALHRVRSTKS